MKLNVLHNNTLKLKEVSTRTVRDMLVQKGRMPSKVAKQVIAMVIKHGFYANGSTTIVAVGHANHHGRKAA